MSERPSDSAWSFVNSFASGRMDLEKPLPQPELVVVQENDAGENNADEEQGN